MVSSKSKVGTFVPFNNLRFPGEKQPPPLIGRITWDAQKFPNGTLMLFAQAPDGKGSIDDLTELFLPDEWEEISTS